MTEVGDAGRVAEVENSAVVPMIAPAALASPKKST